MERTVDECFFHIQNGANIKQGIVDGGFPITRIETISNDCFNRDKMGFAGITDISKYESYVLEDGDLLMSHINSVQYLGRTVLYEKQGNETIIHGMNLLRLKARREIITPAYARYVFYSQPFRTQIARITKKSVNQASFAVTDLKKIKIDVPTISEQMKVVDLLDRIKEIIDNRNSELSQFDNLIEARFVELFGDPYSNSKKWKTLSFKEAGEKLSDGPFGSNLKSEHYTDAGVRVIRLGNIGVRQFIDNDKSYISEEHYKKLSKYTCRAGEIVIATLGEPNLRACLVPKDICKAIHKADCVHYIPKREILNNDFVCQYVNCPETLLLAQGMIHGQTRSRVSSGQIAQMPIFIPPLEMQIEFSDFVKQVDKSKSIVQKSLDEAQLLFDSLMQKFFG